MSFLFFQPAIPQGLYQLDKDESRHAIKVLRKQIGDTIEITDGAGHFYTARITTADSANCSFTLSQTVAVPPRNFSIAIAIAPTKSIDRTEWFLEKAIEVGIEKIYFMVCQNSERRNINIERMQKIAISTIKQSRQAWLPELSALQPFKKVINASAHQKFIGHVDHRNPHHIKNVAGPQQRYLVLIGPEGDFTKEELQAAQDAGFEKVSLGTNRLRTETAALTACQILNFINL